MKEHGIDLLLNTIIERQNLKNDTALSTFLGCNRFIVSKLRCGMKLGPTYILAIHEKTGMPVAEIRTLYRTREES